MGNVAVTVTDDLVVRSEPRVSDDSIMYKPWLPRGTELNVLDGPVSGSGYTWYKVAPVSFAGLDGPGFGWVAMANKDGEPWIALAESQIELPQDATLDAALARCPTAAEIELVDSVVILVFEDDPSAPTLVCTEDEGSANLTHLQERAYQAVLAMRRIPFDAPLPWTDLSLFDWFAREVEGITFRNTEFSYCCDGPGVLVIRSRNLAAMESDLWVGRYPNEAYGLTGLVDLLLHEARHVAGFPHCDGGNDTTLDDAGSWAVVYWFYTWLAEHAPGAYMTPVDAPSDLYRVYARQRAEATLTRFGCPDS